MNKNLHSLKMPSKADIEMENTSLKLEVEDLKKKLYIAENKTQIARSYRIMKEENERLKSIIKSSGDINLLNVFKFI